MKKLLTSLAAFTALTAAASAADLPYRAAPPPPPVFTPVPVFTWTGFYAGLNAGYAFDASNHTTSSGFSSNRDGFTGGGQIGYNYQFTPGSGVVVGVEADAQYIGLRRSTSPAFSTFDLDGSRGLDFFGTARGRIGWAADRVLFYGTGGFAYGAGGENRRFALSGFHEDDFRTGWTAGGGVEYALPSDSFLNFFRSDAVTLRVEALYVNLDSNRRPFGVLAPIGGCVSIGGCKRDTEFAVVRAGVNYKFGTY